MFQYGADARSLGVAWISATADMGTTVTVVWLLATLFYMLLRDWLLQQQVYSVQLLIATLLTAPAGL